MAGIEQIIVHSKSYLVRWIQVPDQHSISWSLQVKRKGINFGIFKHPGTKTDLAPNLPSQETVENTEGHIPSTPALDHAARPALQSRRSPVIAGTVVEKLEGIGMKSVAWTGRCEADKVAMGRYDVPKGEGGTYGLVFDNTFSKTISKNVTFVLMTHPTDTPPKSGHHLHYAQAFTSNPGSAVGSGYTPSLEPVTDSNESLPHSLGQHRGVLEDPRPHSKGGHGVESKGIEGSTFYTGTLYKKRRRKGQGFAKRFFSLDFTSSTLSYYRNRHSSALRGAVPLSLAAIGANEKTREFSVDSGAEVWHLKATNRKDFQSWREAFERASTIVNASAPGTPGTAIQAFRTQQGSWSGPQEQHEWARLEQLVSKVSGTRDAVRGLAKDTDRKGLFSTGLGLSLPEGGSNTPSPTSNEAPSQYFPDVDERGSQRRPFWKRTASAERSPSGLFRRSVSAQLTVPTTSAVPSSPSSGGNPMFRRRPSGQAPQALMQNEVHERCMALLNDLDSVVQDFSTLIAESKARRNPPQLTTGSRLSMDSIDTQEFFDADDGRGVSQLLSIRRSSEFDELQEEKLFDDAREADSDSSSDSGDAPSDSILFTMNSTSAKSPIFPAKPDKLTPLPLPGVKRRATIKPPKQAPPSIIGFLRKNAGKDLSTVSMPVTANEPTSLLQRLAESMEYANLLDEAAAARTEEERLMYVTAFAVSYFANSRVKERAVRKPFNPMLGETFELVREDLGFRFLAEKVSHHPVRMACQAESLNNGGWCYAQSPLPTQKFWGKSVEVNNEGRARAVLHAVGEHYSWSQATCFLRNVIAGEKYVEPVQTMTVQNETNGMRAVATFKAGGMFSGRSEEVSVQLFGSPALTSVLPLGLAGKWTESLKRTDTGETIWTVGSLVPDAAKVYGFTSFAAALNEVTEVEENHLPPTDSRLRPDQRALEMGDSDKAEALKARLEERQRARRKVLETHGHNWTPQFFEKVDGNVSGVEEEVWVLKKDDGYWAKREKSDWSGVQEVFEL
ncbi:oxysterol binding protein [Zymoseptoria brevis]|uniref:Oxysterol binding protein n=1 Tax=Zymoseptoria brevis TaxID=1047168 RepID=A0A0F4GK84_9PEZI|nr:oxysterol binding protein [Zymoseptoria brevis]